MLKWQSSLTMGDHCGTGLGITAGMGVHGPWQEGGLALPWKRQKWQVDITLYPNKLSYRRV